MSQRAAGLAVSVFCLWSAFAPSPAGAVPPLRLREVLESVAQTHPRAEVAEQNIEQAEAEALAARGGFDPLLSVRSRWKPEGYYENGQLDAVLNQPTPIWGVSIYGGYRLGWGEYPIYRRELQTHSKGEVRAGISAPLWRNGPIDARRAAIQRTRIGAQLARRAQNVTQLELEAAAAKAYWTWVAGGQGLDVARTLLEVATERQAGLGAQVQLGAVEPIMLVDNRRLVLDRSGKVVAAKRTFRRAALALSLFLRDEDQTPVVPDKDRVPARFPKPALIDLLPLPEAIKLALQQRPDMAALLRETDMANLAARLARNQRAPELDVETFVAKDLGRGPADLEPFEWGVGAVLELPLLLRTARGELAAAEAEVAATRAKVRGLRDRIIVEVRSEYVALQAAAEMAELAALRLEAAERLEEAERARLRLGVSDLVILNLRELAAADARLEVIEALAEYQRAKADYLVAIGQSPRGYATARGL